MIGLIAPITSLSLTGAFRRVKFRIWSLNLSTDLARGMAYKSSGLALVVRLWAASLLKRVEGRVAYRLLREGGTPGMHPVDVRAAVQRGRARAGRDPIASIAS